MRSSSLVLVICALACTSLNGCDVLFAECGSDGDCGDGVCDDGVCKECVDDGDCDDDDICEDDECTSPECEGDGDCDAGELCDDGRCENGPGEGEGEGEGEAPPPPDPEGPQILQLSTSVETLFEDGLLIVSVVVTDPDGVDDVIGGSLLRAVGGQTYGTFQTSASEGAYEATLDWARVGVVEPVEFTDSLSLTLRAQFFDQAGHVVAQDFVVTLACRAGGSACDGQCGSGRCGGDCTFLGSDSSCGACDVQCTFPRGCASSSSDGFICAGAENDADACADGQDNDEDGFADCDDFDCGPICVPATPEDNDVACSDGLDNDGDGFFDCNDFNCSQNPSVTVCVIDPENNDAICSDGISNDGDNFVDCDDFDCSRNVDVAVCGVDTCGVELGAVSGTIASGALTGNNRSDASCGGTGPDRVFHWTVPADGTWQIDTSGSTVDTVLYLRTACGDFGDFVCARGDLGAPALAQFNATAGQGFFIVVDTDVAAGGSFVLNANPF